MYFNGVCTCGRGTILVELSILYQMLDCIAEAMTLLCCVAVIIMINTLFIVCGSRRLFGYLLLGGGGMRSLCLAHMSSYVVVRVVWTS